MLQNSQGERQLFLNSVKVLVMAINSVRDSFRKFIWNRNKINLPQNALTFMTSTMTKIWLCLIP